MLAEYLYPHKDYFEKECLQIEFWDSLLSEFQEQFKLLNKIVEIQKDTSIQNDSNCAETMQKFYVEFNLNRYSTEPSNLFIIGKKSLELLTKFSKIANDQHSNLYVLINTPVKEIVETIRLVREHIIKSSDKIMTELSNLINKSNDYQKNYDKIKANLDDAQIKKRKIDLKDKYIYNVAVKENAEKNVINNIGEMEDILPTINNLSTEIEQKKEKFNSFMAENFEIVITNTFKCLTNLHQCFFLFSKTIYDINNELLNSVHSFYSELANLPLNISDFTERKYAQNLNMKIDNLNMINLSDEILKTNLNQLSDTLEMVSNYVDVFYRCYRYRKKIIKGLAFYHKVFNESGEIINKLKKKTFAKLNSQISNFSYSFEDLKNSWNNIFQFFLIQDNPSKKSEHINELESYVKVTRSELKNFLSKWNKDKAKIIDLKNDIDKLIRDINIEKYKCKEKKETFPEDKYTNKVNKRSAKAVELLSKILEFNATKISGLREQDIKRIENIINLNNQKIKTFENNFQKIVEYSENEINNSTSVDIMEECQNIFIKYFNKFHIENYEFLFEKIKMKLLLKTDFLNEKLGKTTYQLLNDYSNMFNGQSMILTEENINDFSPINQNNNNFDLNMNNNNYLIDDIETINNEFPILSKLKGNKRKESSSSDEDENNNNKLIENNYMSNYSNNNIKVNEKEFLLDDTLSEVKHVNKEVNFKLSTNENNINNLGNNANEIQCNSEKDVNKTSSLPLNIFDEEKIKFIKEDNFNIFNVKNAYQNFKEPEIKKYKTILQKNPANSKENVEEAFNQKNEIEIDFEEGEQLLKCYTCAYKSKILLQGKLYITNKNLHFISSFNPKSLFGKTKLKIPLLDITEVLKKKNLKIFPNSIKIKTEKIDMIFTSFISRDKCYNIILKQLNEIRKENNLETMQNDGDNDNTTVSPNITSNYLKMKRKKCKQINKMLDNINFFEKLQEIHKQRMEYFINKYRKDLQLIPSEDFKVVEIEDMIANCPLCIIFTYIFNPNIPIEQYGHNVGFFESIFIDRKDQDMICGVDDNENNSPQYFSDFDFVMNLFSNFNQNDFKEFLENVNSWNDIFKFKIKFLHPIKKYFIGPDKVILDDTFIIYFISPICLIIDDISYGSGFPYSDTFATITQYQYDTDIKFNVNKGIFEFKTKCTIRFVCKFIKSCAIQGPVAGASISQANDNIKFYIYDKLKDIVNIQSDSFNEMYLKMTDENIDRIILRNEKIGDVDVNEFADEDNEPLVIEEDNNIKDIKINNNENNITNNEQKNDNTKNNILADINFVELIKNPIIKIAGGIILTVIIILIILSTMGIINVQNINFNFIINIITILLIIYLLVKLEKSKK